MLNNQSLRINFSKNPKSKYEFGMDLISPFYPQSEGRETDTHPQLLRESEIFTSLL